MIPWVIALMLALVCANTIPNHPESSPCGNQDQIGLMQAGDHTPAPDGRVFNPHLVLAAPSGNSVWISPSFIKEFGSTLHHSLPPDRSVEGRVQGRAPPLHAA